jgi:hypothetical protein
MSEVLLASLDFLPYLNEDGRLPESLQTKVGVYAIFDQHQVLRYIGYSRDVLLSLRQHLVRQPQHCYWVKAQLVDRPSRTALEAIKESWIAENGEVPIGNGQEEPLWNQAIDIKSAMTPEEQSAYNTAMDEVAQIKILKATARRVEAEILSMLESRGVKEEFRFNPKLKEAGLLDLK